MVDFLQVDEKDGRYSESKCVIYCELQYYFAI